MRMPNARVVVATVGSPSGTAATAREMVVLEMSASAVRLITPVIKTSAHSAPLNHTIWLPIVFNCLSIGVSGAMVSPIIA